jgi:hypothetical protein
MKCMWPTEDDVLRPFAVGWVVPGRGGGTQLRYSSLGV